MSENQSQSGAAQNKLGELFVQLGVKGLGGVLGGLNKVSAQFLLTKNAAAQAIKPFADISKNASNMVVNFDKLNSITGINVLKLQQLSTWAKLNNVNFQQLVGQIGELQQTILSGRMGEGMKSGFAMLGIDALSLDWHKPIAAMDKIMERVRVIKDTLGEAEATKALSLLGFDSSMLYIYEQAGGELNNINEKLNEKQKLNDKELEASREQNKAWNRLSVSWDMALNKILASTEAWAAALNTVANLLEKISTYIPNEIKSFDKSTSPARQELENAKTEGGKNKAKAKIYYSTNKHILSNWAKKQKDGWLKNTAAVNLLQPEMFAIYEALGRNFIDKMFYPSAIPQTDGIPTKNLSSSTSNNITMNINQNIQSTDPQMAAAESADKIDQSTLSTIATINRFSV